jgi:hypothetical protein
MHPLLKLAMAGAIGLTLLEEAHALDLSGA